MPRVKGGPRGHQKHVKILALAKKLHEPSATLHYNIKKLEREGVIKSYKAVFDYKKIGEGFTAFILIIEKLSKV